MSQIPETARQRLACWKITPAGKVSEPISDDDLEEVERTLLDDGPLGPDLRIIAESVARSLLTRLYQAEAAAEEEEADNIDLTTRVADHFCAQCGDLRPVVSGCGNCGTTS